MQTSDIILAQQAPLSVDQAKKAMDAADQTAQMLAAHVPSSSWNGQLVETLTWGVLLFSTVVIGLVSILLYRGGATGPQILKCFGLVLIITFSSILLIVGYSSEQLTPIVGLFGAIAGYLLGKDHPAPADQTGSAQLADKK